MLNLQQLFRLLGFKFLENIDHRIVVSFDQYIADTNGSNKPA